MTGALIWFLIAIHPNDDISFTSQDRDETVCRQRAIEKSLESKRYLKQPIAFSCIPGTPIQGR